MPISFITGLFDMNAGGMTGLENPNAFAFICLFMLALAGVLLAGLRWLKWV